MSRVSRCALSLLGPFTLIDGFAVINYSIPAGADASVYTSTQKKGKGKESTKDKKSKAEPIAPTQKETPALWEDRGDTSRLNLVLGIGSEAGKPKPPFKFDKEDLTGANPKIKVIDANGVKWNFKFDEEAHSEVAASRIAWACGYMVEESYFLPSGKVSGVTGLGRARKFIEGSKGGSISFHYSGKINALHSVPRERAQWFLGVAGMLSDNQIRDAFNAAGATQTEANGFAAEIRKRINELQAAVR